jgi:hypothetical protein
MASSQAHVMFSDSRWERQEVAHEMLRKSTKLQVFASCLGDDNSHPSSGLRRTAFLDCCRKIAMTLIDPANRLVSAATGRTDGASLC